MAGGVYIYAWGNNPRRAELWGRRCVIEATGRMGTCLVRFLDTGELVTTSRRALRREFPTESAISRENGGGGNRTRVTCPADSPLSSENAVGSDDEPPREPLVTRGAVA